MSFNQFKVVKNSTSNIIHVFVSTTSSATGLSGLAFNTASLTLYKVIPGGTNSAVTLETITTLGTYQAPTSANHVRFREVNSTNMVGIYEVHLPDSWFSGSDKQITLMLRGAAGMGEIPISIAIPAINEFDGQRAGMTALPSADFGKTGGLDSIITSENLAQSAASQTITLAAGDSSTNDIYMGCPVVIASGTGAGQVRVCIGYVGSTKLMTVDQPWEVTPDATSRYRVLARRVPPMDGDLGVIVQALSGSAIASLWGYDTTLLTTTGSIGKFIVDSEQNLMGANAIETGYNLAQAIRIILAVLAGNVSGGGTNQTYIRNITNSKDRVNAIVDSNGNRTVTLADGS